MKLCLNSIVKNESARIVRMLESVAPYICYWVIADTGSTDNTPQLIEEFFAKAKIGGALVRTQFENFSQARNVALEKAQSSKFDFDYILLVDADMELKVLDPKWAEKLDGPAYDMYQMAGTLQYQNRRLIKHGAPNQYLGVTHEYLDVESAGVIPMEKALFVDHADGANRPDKFRRDIKLLKDGLKKEPRNARYMFYLAQSYRDAGDFERAAKWYQRRIDAGGWDQEVWNAQYCLAHCYNGMGREAQFIRNMLIAYNMRPSRAEPIYDLARHYRDKGMPAPALAFAEAVLATPKSDDALFVNDYVASVGGLEEVSISGFYVPHKRSAGYRAANLLTLQKGPYLAARHQARANMFHYYASLDSFCPSFKWKPIKFAPEDGWVAMNPSIAMHGDTLYGVVRTVNYRIDDQGRYLIRGTDGTCNSTNPINTRNWLVDFDGDLEVVPWNTKEISKGGLLPEPPAFPLVVGFEDMRLYATKNYLWASATVRELTPEGYCEQVRTRIGDYRSSTPMQYELIRMLRRGYEKNWMPIIGRSHEFMYRLDEVVDGEGKTIAKYDLPIAVDAISGGSQLIPVHSGYLAMVHEACQIPGAPTRFYSHRFVAFDKDMKLQKITPPFFINEKGIEYVAGLVINPFDKLQLVFSYGFKDCEPRLGMVSVSDVERLLEKS